MEELSDKAGPTVRGHILHWWLSFQKFSFNGVLFSEHTDEYSQDVWVMYGLQRNAACKVIQCRKCSDSVDVA